MSSSARKNFLFHVGYHKTATTWLQHDVLRPEHGFFPALSHDEIFSHVIAPHGLDYDPAALRTLVAARRAASPEECAVDVASLEALSGLPYDGGRESDAYARRLAAAVPDAKILITIREQMTIMASVYMQYVRRAGTGSYERFFDENPFAGYSKFMAQNYRYHRLVGLYQDLFGPENVLVLPLEVVRASQDKALKFLAAFAGNGRLSNLEWTDRKPFALSESQLSVPILRRINHFRRDALNPDPVLDLGPVSDFCYRGAAYAMRHLPLPRRTPVTDHVRARFSGFFVESNIELSAMLAHPVDLSAYEGLGS